MRVFFTFIELFPNKTKSSFPLRPTISVIKEGRTFPFTEPPAPPANSVIARRKAGRIQVPGTENHE